MADLPSLLDEPFRYWLRGLAGLIFHVQHRSSKFYDCANSCWRWWLDSREDSIVSHLQRICRRFTQFAPPEQTQRNKHKRALKLKVSKPARGDGALRWWTGGVHWRDTQSSIRHPRVQFMENIARWHMRNRTDHRAAERTWPDGLGLSCFELASNAYRLADSKWVSCLKLLSGILENA